MILYFSATGNSAYTAKRISEQTGDEAVNLFEKIRNKDYTELTSERPWVLVSPTYAWQLPHIVRDWLSRTPLTGHTDIYFILTCGGSIGNAGHYAKKICEAKKLNYKGSVAVLMPENYIALFDAPDKESSKKIVENASGQIDAIADSIKNRRTFSENPINTKDLLNSGPVNRIFYRFVISDKKFLSTDDCISCGHCKKVCPVGNITMENGKPVWNGDCTHCMACICTCPTKAIEYGKKSKGKVRYTCPY